MIYLIISCRLDHQPIIMKHNALFVRDFFK